MGFIEILGVIIKREREMGMSGVGRNIGASCKIALEFRGFLEMSPFLGPLLGHFLQLLVNSGSFSVIFVPFLPKMVQSANHVASTIWVEDKYRRSRAPFSVPNHHRLVHGLPSGQRTPPPRNIIAFIMLNSADRLRYTRSRFIRYTRYSSMTDRR